MEDPDFVSRLKQTKLFFSETKTDIARSGLTQGAWPTHAVQQDSLLEPRKQTCTQKARKKNRLPSNRAKQRDRARGPGKRTTPAVRLHNANPPRQESGRSKTHKPGLRASSKRNCTSCTTAHQTNDRKLLKLRRKFKDETLVTRVK